MTGEEAERDREAEATPAEADQRSRPRPELRWVQLRDAKRPQSLGRNGRVVASYFHEGYDAWEVLLVTYDGEL